MNMDAAPPMPSDRLLSELDAVTAIIGNTENILCLWKKREDELRASLDRPTAPAPSTPAVATGNHITTGSSMQAPSDPPAADKFKRGYDYQRETHRCREKTEIWVGLMTRILQDFPESHAAIEQGLKARGRIRPYLSRNRTNLFPGKDNEWVKKRSLPLPGGWFLDTNLGGDRIKSLLETVVNAAGLTWGLDVVVRLRR